MMSHTIHPWRGLRQWKRHSLVLLVGGLVYIFIGIGLIVTNPSPSAHVALHIALTWWSFDWWGIIYIAAGVMAIISSKWPPISETWGYMVLTGLSAGWAAFYGSDILWFDSPISNLRGVFTWGLIAFMWWAISGLSNPPPKVEGDSFAVSGSNGLPDS